MAVPIAFIVNVYSHDQALALRLLGQLRPCYPDAPILIIGDGVAVSRELGQQGTPIEMLRQKHLPSGLWTHRYLALALGQTTADVFVKIDPDTCMWRKPEIPDADWFGTPSQDGTFLRGGAVGIRRGVIQSVLQSRLLLKPTIHSYGRFDSFRWPHEKKDSTPISCQDRIMGDVMETLGYPPTPWPDVNILGNPRREALAGDFALSHPHPFPINFRCAAAETD